MRDLNGVLLFDKPPGYTSNGVLQQVRKLYGAKKAGHTGSLDPSATGMLPICFGEATKLCGYMLDAEKTYQVTALLGITTDTEDADGEVLTRAQVPDITYQQMAEAVASFHGEQMQRPPIYSAIKKEGVRAYKLARQGKEVELALRPINVKSISLTDYSEDTFTLELRVSKGTYIRSIARDIGEHFGCGAHVTTLRRLAVSPFDGQAMFTLEDIDKATNVDELLLATDQVISDWRPLVIDASTALRYQNGSKPDFNAIQGNSPEELFRVYNSEDRFLGLGKIVNGKLETVRLIGGQLTDEAGKAAAKRAANRQADIERVAAKKAANKKRADEKVANSKAVRNAAEADPNRPLPQERNGG